jgi:hypothetical protein
MWPKKTLVPWGGPCLPGARGMMDLRLRLPGLVRSLAVTQFSGIPTGYADRGTTVAAEGQAVVKGATGTATRARIVDGIGARAFGEVHPGGVLIVLVGENAWRGHMVSGQACWLTAVPSGKWRIALTVPSSHHRIHDSARRS